MPPKKQVAPSADPSGQTADKKRKKIGDAIETPIQERKRLKISGGSPNSDSSGGSSSNVPVVTASNQDLIVTIREDRTTATGKEVVMLSISNSRPDTALGATQGDHVTAYKSFLEMLITVSEGQSIKKLPYLIADVAKALLPDKAEKFEELLHKLDEEVGKVVPRNKRHEIIYQLRATAQQDNNTLSQIRKALKDSRRAVFMKAGEQMAGEFIKQINLDEEIAFKKEGPTDRTEGSRVKKAIHALKAINDLKSIYDDIKSNEITGAQINEVKLEHFYKKYTKTGALYKDGANAIFGTDKIVALNIKLESALDKKSFLDRLYTDTDKTQIGGFFGDLFDFKHSVHGGKAKVDETLYKVTAKHLVVMFRAFDKFQTLDQTTKDSIIDKFLTRKVLQDQEWNRLKIAGGRKSKPLNLSSLKVGIDSCVKLDEFKLKSLLEMGQVSTSTAQRGGR